MSPSRQPVLLLPGVGPSAVARAEASLTESRQPFLGLTKAAENDNLDRFQVSLEWKETQPIAPNGMKAGRAPNRRVELTVRPLEMQ